MRTLQTGTISSKSKGIRYSVFGLRNGCLFDRTPNTEYRIPAAGFTLIELLIVLVALVVLASAVVPALRNAGHQEDLAEVADRVAASARFARDEAVARQSAIVLTVDPQPAAVRLTVDTQGAGVTSGSGTGGAGGGMASTAPLTSTLALPSAFALVRMQPRFQARLEAVPETFNGSATATRASGAALQTLRFPPEGRTMGGMVVLTDDRGRSVRIVVTPNTGVVRVEAGNNG
jgi:prepilin-type N-terminal cleavage/methylation domain-containing protein